MARNTTVRPGSIDDTSRVQEADHAPTRVFRQAHAPRTRAPAIVIVDPDARRRPLAHPRLVRRAEPPASLRGRDFEDEPTTRGL